MSPELHSPTVTVLSPAKLYNRKMKLYTSVCLTSYQMILLMNKTNHFSYFTEIIISSRFKESYLFSKSHIKVKSMHRSGTEAIRPQIQPSKPKRLQKAKKKQREHMVNRASSYPPPPPPPPKKKKKKKRWPPSNPKPI